MKNSNSPKDRSAIKRLTGVAMLAALVAVLQLLGQFIKFGPVSISLVLIPIVVGAALYGPAAGAVLGGVFSVVVLLQPDTAFFYGISVFGTIVTVLAKGCLAGLLSGLTYRAIAKKNPIVGVFTAAAVCPIVNTGIFFLGCRLFFWNAMAEMGSGNAFMFVITTMIGFNFIAELAANIICAPVIMRIIKIVKKN